jgi:hypothetical protein
MSRLSREEMIDLVARLQRGEGDDDQAAAWIEALGRSLPHPRVSDLIFYPDEPLTPEQIVDKALGYRPIEL